MSAWIVSKVHIDLLVRFAVAGREHGFSGSSELAKYGDTPDALGQMLVTENVLSVATRYPDDTVNELPGPLDAHYLEPYAYADPGYTLTPGEVFKALDCYEYQTCEHDGWPTSEAHGLCRMLRYQAERNTNGYESAPWGFDAENVQEIIEREVKGRLEELRVALRSESISYGELAELQGLAGSIEPGDVELLEAAGVPEFGDDE